MSLAGALQASVDLAVGTLSSVPGGTVEAAVTPPGGATLAGVPVLVRRENPTAALGVVGTQRTGARILVPRNAYADRLADGTTIVAEGVTWLVRTCRRGVAFWDCEATRG